MPNPWIIVGFLLALIVVGAGAYTKGHSDGVDGERVVWQKRENAELAAANAKIIELNKAARDAETVHAAAVNLISTTLQGQTNAARAETERLRAAARAGTFRLRDPAGRESTCPGGAPETGPTAGQRDGGQGAYLSAAAADFLLGLTGEADEVVAQLTACQGVVIEDRKVR